MKTKLVLSTSYQALDKARYNIIPVGITKTGTWVKGEAVVKALVAGGKIIEPAEKTSILPDPTAKHLAKYAIYLGYTTS